LPPVKREGEKGKNLLIVFLTMVRIPYVPSEVFAKLKTAYELSVNPPRPTTRDGVAVRRRALK